MVEEDNLSKITQVLNFQTLYRRQESFGAWNSHEADIRRIKMIFFTPPHNLKRKGGTILIDTFNRISLSRIYFVELSDCLLGKCCTSGIVKLLSAPTMRILRFLRTCQIQPLELDKFFNSMSEVKQLQELSLCWQLVPDKKVRRPRQRLMYSVGLRKLHNVMNLKCKVFLFPYYSLFSVFKGLRYHHLNVLTNLVFHGLFFSDADNVSNFSQILENCSKTIESMSFTGGQLALPYDCFHIFMENILLAESSFGLKRLNSLQFVMTNLTAETVHRIFVRFVAHNQTVSCLSVTTYIYPPSKKYTDELKIINEQFGRIKILNLLPTIDTASVLNSRQDDKFS